VKVGRSTLPLPRYTRRKRLKKGGFGYFFDVPTWAREKGCPVTNEPLGSDYDLAVQRSERILLPAFDSWLRGGDDGNPIGVGVVIGTLDWMFHEYRRTWKQKTAKRLQPGRRLMDQAAIVDPDTFARVWRKADAYIRVLASD
jgi:hypothetical protein